MPKQKPTTRGQELARRLRAGLKMIERAPRPGARSLPVLRGVTPKCAFTLPAENVLGEATDILVASGRVYAYGGDVMLETGEGAEASLEPLACGHDVRPPASSLFPNLMICACGGGEEQEVLQYPPPSRFVSIVLNADPVRAKLPKILAYAQRPVFDEDYNLRGPGYHPDLGLLVHGPHVDPIEPPPAAPDRPIIERLPTHLRRVLGGFCFASAADIANMLGALLTALLITHFIRTGKPVVLFDGNQPGLGKTLLMRLLGVLLDGHIPGLTGFTADEDELGKRICATLRGGGQTVVALDNAKVRSGEVLNSATLEKASEEAWIIFRILGQSSNFRRPNDVIWGVTMNGTKASSDLMSRALPVRLQHDGDPSRREFHGADPLAYALEHRVALLGELAGLVVRWNRLGRPPGRFKHRFRAWAATVGGILASAGFPEFLSNLESAAAAFVTGLDELSALAEVAVKAGEPAVAQAAGPATGRPPGTSADAPGGMPAAQWETLIRQARILTDALDQSPSAHSRSTIIGNFFGRSLGREVPIEVEGRPGRARLEVEAGRGRHKRYYFIVAWDDAASDLTTAAPPEAPPEMALGATPGIDPGGRLTGNEEDWA